ncbi:site-specific integrase [Manganibacter manganicus]|uniref:Tyr recombinase domain-containing protein n=1 Tax=Manganibacter manganicus TaxID=1873176 RepID=A0A1V8RSQ3_9HYPH|nr:site-specific integrase [Pseudaminobacter manganicus]OQM76241.1 hypothetical protein BFN67_15210 [Pseudaminobacter manganicus]
MIKIVRNKKLARPIPIATLGDLHRFIDRCDLTVGRKAEIRSAIKRMDELVGHGGLDLAADPVKIFAALEKFSPAMAGISAGSFANLKSRLRAAFKLASPHLKSTRSIRLDGEWLSLHKQLPMREQRQLSRFLRFCYAAGWEPDEISDAHMERFAAHLREEAMVAYWKNTVRDTIRAWNRAAAQREQLALQNLTPPAPKRKSYWLDVSSLPESLQKDIDAFLAHLKKPTVFAGQSRQLLKPTTVNQYRNAIVTLLSALAGAGEDVASITTLASVVTARKLETALIFLYERFNQRVTSGMVITAARMRKIAIWAELPEQSIREIDELIRRLDAAAPRKRGLTAKNKALLDRLDDARFRDLVYTLPLILMKKARQQANPVWAASLARAAVAIELLLTCSMRRANLISLELERNIRKIGNGKDAHWIIEFEEQDVKNGERLRYQLPAESAELLADYLRHWRSALCDVASSWLFPAPDGNCMDARHLAEDVKRKAEQELGVPVTPHQFRHVSVELYLRNNPDKLSIASSHLGHRDTNTTRMYYARSKQREASRLYQERLGLDRSHAADRARSRLRRKPGPNTGFDAEDIL